MSEQPTDAVDELPRGFGTFSTHAKGVRFEARPGVRWVIATDARNFGRAARGKPAALPPGMARLFAPVYPDAPLAQSDFENRWRTSVAESIRADAWTVERTSPRRVLRTRDIPCWLRHLSAVSLMIGARNHIDPDRPFSDYSEPFVQELATRGLWIHLLLQAIGYPAPLQHDQVKPAADDGLATSVRQDDYSWSVWAHNDPILSQSYIAWMFESMLHMRRETAIDLMWRIHTTGRAIVVFGPRPDCEEFAGSLQRYGVRTTVEEHR